MEEITIDDDGWHKDKAVHSDDLKLDDYDEEDDDFLDVDDEDDDEWKASPNDDNDEEWGDIEEDFEDNGNNNNGNAINKRLSFETAYEIISREGLAKHRQVIINEIVDALFGNQEDRSWDMSIQLLHQHNWNKQAVIDKYVCDPEQAMINSGITPMEICKPMESGLFECPQCYDDVPYDQAFSLKCGHASCKNCWVNYLTYMSSLGGEGIVIKCNHAGCSVVVPESCWKRLLPKKLLDKREKFVLDHFVQAQRDIVWCPGADCDNAVKDPMRSAPAVICPCGTNFCFLCQELTHRPCSCADAKKWMIKCSSDAENATYILAHTKKCPKCQTQIEKNQGCNHMTCRVCKFEFCWLCKGNWKDHGTSTGGFYRCNRYQETQAAGTQSEEELKSQDAKTELQKYLHFFMRFDNHSKAIKFALNSLEKVVSRMRTLQELRGGGYNDVSFLEKAVNTVIECRHLLKWTYAMGYYMEPNTKEKNLFEHLQENLEKNTEQLHELSEKPLEELIGGEIRAKIINYTRVTIKFSKNLTRGIENGLTTEV